MDWLKDLWENLNKPVPQSEEKKPKLAVGNGRISQGEYDRYVGNLNSGSAPKQFEGGKAFSRAGTSQSRVDRNREAGRTNYRPVRNPPPRAFPNVEEEPPRMPGVGAIQEDDFSDLMAELEGRIKTPFSYNGEYDDMINSAFGAQLAALANARTQTQGNFNESSEALKGLYAGHVQDINTVDAGKYAQINSQLKGGLNSVYDNATSTIQADKQNDLAESEAMLQRLGLQAAAPAVLEQSQAQTDALARLQQEKASALTQATEYGNADQTRNVARGQSVAGEGIQRQGDLRQQLQGILGDLSMREADITSDKAMAQMEAQNMARQAWQEERGMDTDTLQMLLQQMTEENMAREDMQLKRESMNNDLAIAQAKNSGGGVAAPLWESIGQSLGVDITPYRNAYAKIAAEGGYNSQSGANRIDFFLKKIAEMAQEDPRIDKAIALEAFMSAENAGTFKRQ